MVGLISTDGLIVVSNILLVVVTALASAISGIALAKESHRHEEEETTKFAKIAHAVLEEERRNDANVMKELRKDEEQRHD